jgi:translation initiation factor IF-2
VTDIVVLVVAADDGVMPQTIEAINHAKAAGVPMIVAINKIDKPDANRSGAHRTAAARSVQVESMGGEVARRRSVGQDKRTSTSCSKPSAAGRNPRPQGQSGRPAEGTVIEAKLDRGRGPVATVLVQRGTLRTGDIVVAGAEWGRVRALINDQGETTIKGRSRRCRSRCSASTARPRPATASRWSRTRPAPARSPSTAAPPEAREVSGPHAAASARRRSPR